MAAADPAKGRFRSFLLICRKRLVAVQAQKANAVKRGGRNLVISLDDQDAAERYALENVEDLAPEVVFDPDLEFPRRPMGTGSQEKVTFMIVADPANTNPKNRTPAQATVAMDSPAIRKLFGKSLMRQGTPDQYVENPIFSQDPKPSISKVGCTFCSGRQTKNPTSAPVAASL